jgi:hypothetical protein
MKEKRRESQKTAALKQNATAMTIAAATALISLCHDIALFALPGRVLTNLANDGAASHEVL